MDAFEEFKAAQKAGWAYFAPMEMITSMPAARLVKFAGIRPGQRVLDVGCGTGVVAVTAARLGATVTGLDLTPQLLERARQNSQIAEVQIDWREGDAENLPFEDNSFDVVLSQFAHMFAPRPARALSEMLRVLKPGGTIAFSTWPPDLMMGRMFSLLSRYAPPPPPGVAPPPQWGDRAIVTERLGNAVRGITFENGTMLSPALSPQHFRAVTEQAVGPVIKLVHSFSTADPAKLASLRHDYDALTSEYFDGNSIQQVFLMTRATKI